MKEDFGLNHDSDRQKYLSDLERLRRIKENEQFNNKNKTVSEFIEDYYYDVDDFSSPLKSDFDYDEYEDFLMKRNQNLPHSDIETDLFLSESESSQTRQNLERLNALKNIRKSQDENTIHPFTVNKKEEFLEVKSKANRPIKQMQPMQSGLRLPELKGDLEQRRLAIQQAKKEEQALQKKELEAAALMEQRRREEAILEQRRFEEELERRRKLHASHPPQNRKNQKQVSRRNNTAPRAESMVVASATASSKKLKSMPSSTRHASSKALTNAKTNKTVSRRLSNDKSAKKSHFIHQNTKQKEKNTPPVPFGTRVKKFFSNLIKIILVSFLFFTGFLVYSFFSKQEGYYTIAIFGVDSRDGNVGKDALADVNMIANINRETGAIQLVSVYRDMITEIDGNGNYHKLNEAYFKGGASRAVAALERNLDLDIEGYATFNWKAVVDGINILGGIDLEITEPEFKYINGFITETVEGTGVASKHLEHAGMNHLDGVQAVAYARLRLMDTDFNRTERQRKVVKLAMEKAKKADFATINNIMVTILPQIATNLTLDDMIPFAKDIKKYYLAESTGFPFELVTMNIGKRDYVVPVTLKSNVVKLHSFLYGESGDVNYTPSNKLREISKYIIKVSGHGEDNDNIEIKIDNGGDGGIGPKGNKSSTAHSSEVAETQAQTPEETTQPTVESTTVSTENTQASESMEEITESPVLTPETSEIIEDRGDAGIPDEEPAEYGPGVDAVSEDAQNGPGVNP